MAFVYLEYLEHQVNTDFGARYVVLSITIGWFCHDLWQPPFLRPSFHNPTTRSILAKVRQKEHHNILLFQPSHPPTSMQYNMWQLISVNTHWASHSWHFMAEFVLSFNIFCHGFYLCWIALLFAEIMLYPIFVSSVCVVDVLVVIVVVVNFLFERYLLWSFQTDWMQWVSTKVMEIMIFGLYYRRIRHSNRPDFPIF